MRDYLRYLSRVSTADYDDTETPADGAEGAFERAVTQRTLMRGLAVVFVVATFIAVATHSLTHHPGRVASRAASKLVGGVVQYDMSGHAPIAPWIKPKPELCNVGVVLDTCLRLNGQAPDYLDNDPQSPKAVVSSSTLASYFMASQSAVESFLKNIGAADFSAGGDYTVKCEQLCVKTVAAFATSQLPPVVDVGCYYKPPALEPACSVDLALSSLMHTGIPKGSEAWRKEFLENGETRWADAEVSEIKVLDSLSGADYDALAYPKISKEQLQLEAARLFRVFPGSKKVSLDISSSVSIARKLWDDSCASANDGKCDVPFSCADGTDCTDCGTCDGRLPQDTCVYQNDQFCDEPRYCLVGTDCTDCDSCGWGGETLEEQIKKTKPNDSCEFARDGSCDASPKCEEGTDCTDCNSCAYSGSHFAPPQYPELVLSSVTKTQGLLAIALLGLQAGGGGDILTDLVGKDDASIRTELKRAIAGLSRLLDNVKFVYPGAKCEARTMGYIDAEKLPAAGEPYTINLCKMFMEGNPYQHLVTLIEVGLHSTPTLAETAVLDGKPVYDLAMVRKLAKACQASGGDACTKSVRNAQSILYVINGFAKCSL